MFILLVTDFNGRCGLYKKYLCAAILNLVLSILFDQIIFASHNSHLKEFRFCKTFKDKLVQLLVDYCENLPVLKETFYLQALNFLFWFRYPLCKTTKNITGPVLWPL